MKISEEQGAVLLAWARAILREALGGEPAVRPTAPWCEAPGAAFVTLRWADTGELQGCIGSLEARRALVDDVAENTVAAGTRDRRGQVLTLEDVDALDMELSILSPLEPLSVASEEDALRVIRPNVDGLVLQMGTRRGTFLPSMWPRLPTPREFLTALKEKAGIQRDRWAADTRMWRYVVDKYVDPAPRRAA
jgi:AmmeMemoRadiSam system protein A